VPEEERFRGEGYTLLKIVCNDLLPDGHTYVSRRFAMRARDIVGKKVKRVVQQRTHDSLGNPLWELQGIEFENGTYLHLSVAEQLGDYAVTAHVYRATKGQDE
jgi:hypothetical protein